MTARKVRPAPLARPALLAVKGLPVPRGLRVLKVRQARKALRDLRAQSEREIHRGD
jgi:hypothetical protein